MKFEESTTHDLRRARAEREWIKGDKAEEGSTLNKLLNKRGPPADAIVEQTGRGEGGGGAQVRDIYRSRIEWRAARTCTCMCTCMCVRMGDDRESRGEIY